jgi:glyoxylase-like metal-dependent hydrolase (beta-lactamase superfamily II)
MKEPRVVLAGNAGLFTLDGTRTFVLGRERIAVLDPGPADARHLDRIAYLVEGAREGVILLTHGHPDHAEGAPALAHRTGFPVAGGGTGVDRTLIDGDRIPVDDGWLEAVSTPGHTRTHLAFLHRDGGRAHGDLFAGDLLLGEGTTTWVGEYGGCLRDYLTSLDRVESLAPSRIFPAHGPVLDDPLEAVQAFRAHRESRIRQVEAALQVVPGGRDAAGRDTSDAARAALVEALVDRVYGSTLPAKAREGARWSIRAALEFLGVAPFPTRGAPTERGDRLAPGS